MPALYVSRAAVYCCTMVK